MADLEAELPPGYRLELGGIDEEAGKGARQLAITGVLIFPCLIVQYNSFVKPLMVLMTIPLAAMGGLVGLYLMGLPMGFMETLGFLALFGIVLSAAILLVDFSERLIGEKVARGKGLPSPGEKSCSGISRGAFRQTLVEAGNMRLMPILMTTLTTVGGLLPLMLSHQRPARTRDRGVDRPVWPRRQCSIPDRDLRWRTTAA
jgi:multidrug efflux pump subunit AcrB